MSAAAFADLVVRMLSGVSQRDIVVGPPLWSVEQGEYFIVACCKAGAFHFDTINVKRGEPLTIEQVRDGFLGDLAKRPGLDAHVFDDEFQMIEACAFYWPCEGIKQLRTRFETESAFARLQARGLAPH